MSAYDNQPVCNWKNITDNLIQNHPLSLQEISDAVFTAWDKVWNTVIGGHNGYRLRDASPLPPAQVVGYLLEMLTAKEINSVNRDFVWGRGSEKDIHCCSDDYFSIEMKTSGQLAYSIFGNRSYGQTGTTAKKDKSGFYITVNYFETTITLIRFGWIDSSDWTSQAASTGQAATLSRDAYDYKLVEIEGPYMLEAPVQLVNGVGAGILSDLHLINIQTIRDLLENRHVLTSTRMLKAYDKAYAQYGHLL
jgi:hypothetical protein